MTNIDIAKILTNSFETWKLKFWDIIKANIVLGVFPLFIGILLAVFVASLGARYLHEVAVVFLMLAIMVGIFYCMLVLSAAQIIIVRDRKKTFAMSELFVLAKPFAWKIFFFGIITFFMIIVSFFIFIIPAIILAVYLYLGINIIINENKGPLETISRSFELLQHKWWLTVLLLIILYVIHITIMSVASIGIVIAQIMGLMFDSVIVGSIIMGMAILITMLLNIALMPLTFAFNQHIYEAYKKAK